MKNMSNPTINDVIIIFLKDDLKEKPVAIGLLNHRKIGIAYEQNPRNMT